MTRGAVVWHNQQNFAFSKT